MKITICLILVRFIHEIQFFDPVNKQVISKMKNEFKGKIIGVIPKVLLLRRLGGVGGGGALKSKQKRTWRGGFLACVYVRLKKKC